MLLGALGSHVAVAFGASARGAAQVAAAAAIAVVIAGLLNVARGAVVKRVRVPLARFPLASYTIVHLTDVHIGPLIGRAFQTVLERVPVGYEVVIHCGGNS